MLKKFVAMAAAALMLAGCATAPPSAAPKAPSDRAGLYVYRDSMGRGLNNNIKLNGKCLGQSLPGGYFYLELPPGQHKLETIALFRQNVVKLNMQAGKNYYVRHYLQLHLVAPYPSLEVMPEEEAHPAVAKLTQLERGRCK